MAKVLKGTIKMDGKVFEVGTPTSKLPKKVRDLAIKNGMLYEEPEEEVEEDEPADEEESTDDEE